MANWYRVWRSTTIGSTGLTDCLNQTSAPQADVGTVMDGLATNIQTIGGAVAHYGELLRRRLDARMTQTGTTEYQYVLTFRRGSRTDQVTVTVGSMGRYPVQIGYTTPHDSGSATFYSFDRAVDWLVDRLRV